MDLNTVWIRISHVWRNHTKKTKCATGQAQEFSANGAAARTPQSPIDRRSLCVYILPRNTGTSDSRKNHPCFASWPLEATRRGQESLDLDLDSDRGRGRHRGLERAALPLPLPTPPPPSPEGEDDEDEDGERGYGSGDEHQRRGGHGGGEGGGRGAKMVASPSPFLRCTRARVLANLLSVGFLGSLFLGAKAFFWGFFFRCCTHESWAHTLFLRVFLHFGF